MVHAQVPVPLHVPWPLHGSGMHEKSGYWHVAPLHPPAHAQVYEAPPLAPTQVPPLPHGFGAQGSSTHVGAAPLHCPFA